TTPKTSRNEHRRIGSPSSSSKHERCRDGITSAEVNAGASRARRTRRRTVSGCATAQALPPRRRLTMQALAAASEEAGGTDRALRAHCRWATPQERACGAMERLSGRELLPLPVEERWPRGSPRADSA